MLKLTFGCKYSKRNLFVVLKTTTEKTNENIKKHNEELKYIIIKLIFLFFYFKGGKTLSTKYECPEVAFKPMTLPRGKYSQTVICLQAVEHIILAQPT